MGPRTFLIRERICLRRKIKIIKKTKGWPDFGSSFSKRIAYNGCGNGCIQRLRSNSTDRVGRNVQTLPNSFFNGFTNTVRFIANNNYPIRCKFFFCIYSLRLKTFRKQAILCQTVQKELPSDYNR